LNKKIPAPITALDCGCLAVYYASRFFDLLSHTKEGIMPDYSAVWTIAERLAAHVREHMKSRGFTEGCKIYDEGEGLFLQALWCEKSHPCGVKKTIALMVSSVDGAVPPRRIEVVVDVLAEQEICGSSVLDYEATDSRKISYRIDMKNVFSPSFLMMLERYLDVAVQLNSLRGYQS
jgi:hypothetical protein